MKFPHSLKPFPKPPVPNGDASTNDTSTWARLLSPLPSPSSEHPPSSYFPNLSPGAQSTISELWPDPPSPASPCEQTKRPSSFFRSSSYRSERSFISSSSRGTSKSREPEPVYVPRLVDRVEPILPLLSLDPDSAIFGSVSPFCEDSGDEGFAFEHLRSSSLRVIVVGAGFAGLSSAIACARKGFAVTVVERSDGTVATGDSILLGSNASRILYKWGIGKEMYQKSSRNNAWIFNDKAGKEVHREVLTEMSVRYGAPILQGKRSRFIGVLGTEARLLGVKIRYDSEVTGYSDSERPAVILKGGEILRGDVVIVCDGVRAVSQTLLANPMFPPMPRRPSGYSIFRGIVASKLIRSDPLCAEFCDGNIRFWLGLDRHVELWPMNDRNELAFTFTHPDVSATSSLNCSANASISVILDEISSWDPALQACIAKFPKALNWTILEDSVGARWVSNGGKIVFAGDAVHPLSVIRALCPSQSCPVAEASLSVDIQPASFQAGTLAVEDGATVAQCLALSGAIPSNVPLALKVYHRLRRERVEQAGRAGRKQQRILHTFLERRDTYGGATDSTSSLAAADAGHEVLRPLCFDLFDHDAEQYAEDNFAAVAAEVERELGCSFNL